MMYNLLFQMSIILCIHPVSRWAIIGVSVSAFFHQQSVAM